MKFISTLSSLLSMCWSTPPLLIIGLCLQSEAFAAIFPPLLVTEIDKLFLKVNI